VLLPLGLAGIIGGGKVPLCWPGPNGFDGSGISMAASAGVFPGACSLPSGTIGGGNGPEGVGAVGNGGREVSCNGDPSGCALRAAIGLGMSAPVGKELLNAALTASRALSTVAAGVGRAPCSAAIAAFS
jgi:hypothetical protein